MHWISEEIYSQIETYLKHSSKNSLILLRGEEGMGKSRIIRSLAAENEPVFALVFHCDFEKERMPEGRLFHPHQIKALLKNHLRTENFLSGFSEKQRQDILLLLNNTGTFNEEDNERLYDFLLQFMHFLSETRKLLIVFENIQQLNYAGLESLQQFYMQLHHLPVVLFLTAAGDNPLRGYLEPDAEFLLQTPSMQWVEKQIGSHYPTSALNARLITNLIYLKSGGNLLKLRFLLEGIFRPLVEEAGDQYLNIESLRQIRISGDWPEIFKQAFNSMAEAEQQFWVFMASLDQPVPLADLQKLMEKTAVKMTRLERWLQGGFLQTGLAENRNIYYLGNRAWQNWLQHQKPLEEIKGLLLDFYNLQKKGMLQERYSFSQLLYEVGEMSAAMETARLEVDQNLQKGALTVAADRLYFILRRIRIHPQTSVNSQQILHKLADVYYRMGAWENAFETFRQLREEFSPANDVGESLDLSLWLDINLKMVAALIEMDAYHEARYLLREIRVKEFCDELSLARCSELSADIEINQIHTSIAGKKYRAALAGFIKFDENPAVIRVYNKIKKLPDSSDEKLLNLINEVRENAPPGSQIWRMHFLKDEVRILMQYKSYKPALDKALHLNKMIRNRYYPRWELQITFYLSEIYAQLGQSHSASNHLEELLNSKKILHRSSWQVQAHLQLGLFHKELAEYGKAYNALKTGLEVAEIQELPVEVNEIRLHLGHLMLLTHGLLQAREFLLASHHWAEVNRHSELLLLSKFYLAYYEIQQGREVPARRYLAEAKPLVNLSGNRIDYLNYLYYYGLWCLTAGRLKAAGEISRVLLVKGADIPRYRSAADYLFIQVLRAGNDFQTAQAKTAEALNRISEIKLPQIEYLLRCSDARLAFRSGDHNSFKEKVRTAYTIISKIANGMEDKILKTQFLEARQHEDIVKWHQELEPKLAQGEV
ncbi:MAG: ATP-binding protein, partial [Calditrichia bacterium]